MALTSTGCPWLCGRAATLDAKPRALVADFNKERGEAVGNVVKEVGFVKNDMHCG